MRCDATPVARRTLVEAKRVVDLGPVDVGRGTAGGGGHDLGLGEGGKRVRASLGCWGREWVGEGYVGGRESEGGELGACRAKTVASRCGCCRRRWSRRGGEGQARGAEEAGGWTHFRRVVGGVVSATAMSTKARLAAGSEGEGDCRLAGGAGAGRPSGGLSTQEGSASGGGPELLGRTEISPTEAECGTRAWTPRLTSAVW